MPIRSLSDWQVHSLRTSAFLTSLLSLDTETSWWEQAVGEPPETKLSRPKQGLQQQEGPFAGGQIGLVLQPNRVDWHFTAEIMSGFLKGAETVQTFPETLRAFSVLVAKWLEMGSLPPIGRLAFGAVLLLPVADRNQGYRQLSDYLSYVRVPEGEEATDLLYQINRPRKSISGPSSLQVNRLSKWSVARLRLRDLDPRSVSDPLQEKYFCQLELDINTSPEWREELSRPYLIPVFEELIRLGEEIAQEGDQP